MSLFCIRMEKMHDLPQCQRKMSYCPPFLRSFEISSEGSFLYSNTETIEDPGGEISWD